MGVKYEDKFVKCPFYRRHEDKIIVCEGLYNGNTIHLAYETYTDKKSHMHEYCYSILGCRDCPVHMMLDQKYEEVETNG